MEKYGITDEFEPLQTLYVGKFCAGVTEGNRELLIRIDEGIERIHEDELESLYERWIPQKGFFARAVIKWILISAGVIIGLMIFWHIVVLRVRVRNRTNLLEAAQMKYQQLIDYAYEGIGVSQEGRYKFVNPSMTRITGFSMLDLITRNNIEFVHPEDRNAVEKEVDKFRESKDTSATFSFRIITADGDCKWLLLSSVKIDWEEKPAELNLITDITELKRAEVALEKADKQLRAIVDVSPVPIIVSRAEDGKIVYANDNLGNLVGYKKEELIGQLSPDFYFDRNERKKVLEILQRDGRLDNHEVRIKRRNGDVIWTIFSLAFTEISGEKVIIGGLYDISERKEVEEALRVSEERFRSLVENANDIIYSMTPKGNFSYLSPRFTEITGFSLSEALGKSLVSFIHPDDAKMFRQWIVQGMPKSDILEESYEFRIMAKSGGWRWITTNSSVITDENGNVLEAIGVAHDITEMKRVLEDLEKANRELRDTQTQLVQSEKMASLGMLVAGVAHEINTPLGAINSMHNTLVRPIEKLKRTIDSEYPGANKIKEKLLNYMAVIDEANKVIESGSSRVTNIVKRLRSFARLDEAEFKDADINEGLEDTLTIVHHELKHNVEVIRDYGNIPKISCFPGQLNQVFLNILVNAGQAIKEKGRINISTYSQNGWIVIKISDNGSGIPQETVNRIFDPGYTTKGVGVGTGLGLSICYQIIQAHKGRIRVESKVGEGTTFYIELPIKDSSV